MSTSVMAVESATQTNYPVLVNGYECYSAAAVAEARNFENPAAASASAPQPSVNQPEKSGWRGTFVNVKM